MIDMKLGKDSKWILFVLAAVSVVVLSSCGQIQFDVGMDVGDVKNIDLSELVGANYTVKVETYVETGTDYGIELSKLLYNYTLENHGSNSIDIEVRLSLYGEATLDDNNKISVSTDADSDGYIDDEKTWLLAPYKDTLSDEGYGWVSIVGSPSSPISLDGDDAVTAVTELLDNDVVREMLSQGGIWIDAYISPKITDSVILGYWTTAFAGAYMDILDQSIEAEGMKATGYFPGALGIL